MKILVTGGAGFIGNYLTLRLLADGHDVVIVDTVNAYYDPTLKEARLKRLPDTVPVYRVDIADMDALETVFKEHTFDAIAHLAAQAGVRYSLIDPLAYARTNYLGTQNILEMARLYGVPHVVLASTSSVYGKNKDMPFQEDTHIGTPISVYAASKRGGELLGHVYAHLFGINVTCLRFFTVYGPWGRPDMALFLFTEAMLNDKPIELYNGGDMKRDFTYVDDIVEGFARALERPMGYEIINLGHGKPVHLREFVALIEETLGKKASVVEKEMQPGDVSETFANVSKAKELLGFSADVSVEEGVKNFVKWYRDYYKK